MFITFKTLAQAKNYIKRHPDYSFTDGCGCCGTELNYSIKGNKVIYFHLHRYAGSVSTNCVVVGKIKSRVESSASK
jgi:hypothetical protein